MERMSDGRQPHHRYVATEHRPSCVIVADDDPDVVQLVSVALRRFGFDIVQARNGTELLARIAGEPQTGYAAERPDVIVTDIRMPGLTGLEILAALRQAHWPTGVVLMTAYADEETREEAHRLGANAVFAKPFDVDDLVLAVVNMMPPPSGSRGD